MKNQDLQAAFADIASIGLDRVSGAVSKATAYIETLEGNDTISAALEVAHAGLDAANASVLQTNAKLAEAQNECVELEASLSQATGTLAKYAAGFEAVAKSELEGKEEFLKFFA